MNLSFTGRRPTAPAHGRLALVAGMITIVLFCATQHISAQAAPARLQVPDAATQKRVDGLIATVYADDIAAAKTPEKKIALVAKLLKAAADSANDRPSQFGLLKSARGYAMAAMNVDQTVAITQQIVTLFDCDRDDWTDSSLSALSHTTNVADAHALLPMLDAEADQAQAGGNNARAERIIDLSVTVARTTGVAEMIAREKRRLAQVQAAIKDEADFQNRLSDLIKDPDDPQSNLAVGTVYAVRGQWSAALPLLAKSDKPALASAAAMKPPAAEDGPANAALADAWMAAAASQSKPLARAIQLHAGKLYRLADPKLSGLAKARVEQELDKLAMAFPFRGLPVEYSWEKDDPQMSVMSADAGFCILGSIGGHLNGYGEHADIKLSDAGSWATDCGDKTERLTARFVAYKVTSDRMYQSQVSFFKWTRGDPPVKMIKKDEGVCFLTGVAGHFAGVGEHIDLMLRADGYWYLQGASGQDQLSGTAVAVKFPNPLLVTTEGKAFTCRGGDAPIRLIAKDEGICGLIGISGSFGNNPNQTGLRLGADNFWYLDAQGAANKDRWVKAAVFKYPAEKE